MLKPILVFFTAFLLGSCFIAGCAPDAAARPTPVVPPQSTDPTLSQGFTILSANIGNSSLFCWGNDYKLCRPQVFRQIQANITALNPDIVVLQELLGSWQCNSPDTDNPDHICYQLDRHSQARALLGEGYTILLNDRNDHEAIGVRTDVGSIQGCPVGGECRSARTAPPIDGCNAGFTVSAGTVLLSNGLEFDIVNMHPQSNKVECRAEMTQQAFDQGLETPLIQHENVLILGDFNFDPWRKPDLSASVWNANLEQGWSGRPFRYHSGVVERDPPYYTFQLLLIRRTLDFTVSNFGDGILAVMGKSAGTVRLDGGWGMDHKALYGYLSAENSGGD